jgi:hypothetical protein
MTELFRNWPDDSVAIADEVIEWAPRVHHASGQRGGVAARGARAAAGDAGDWISQWPVSLFSTTLEAKRFESRARGLYFRPGTQQARGLSACVSHPVS